MIVVDTNVLAYHLTPGPRRDEAKEVYLRDPEWAAPSLYRIETANFLAGRVSRGESTLPEALLFLEEALAAIDQREFPVDPADALRAAVVSGCTAYDCEFVVLARTLAVPLVTCDRQVLRAFPGVAVSMQAFARRG